MENRRGKLFVVSGASGVGKTTVVNKFLQHHADQYNIDKAIAYTTKKPRSGEVDGRDYYFISDEDFQKKINEGFFLEWSGEYGALYGTPSSILKELDSGKSWILVIDRRGAQQIAQVCKEALLILITVSSLGVIEERLKSRGTETVEQIEGRLLQSKKEIAAENIDSIYHCKINNDFLKDAVNGFEALVERVLSG